MVEEERPVFRHKSLGLSGVLARLSKIRLLAFKPDFLFLIDGMYALGWNISLTNKASQKNLYINSVKAFLFFSSFVMSVKTMLISSETSSILCLW